MEDKIKNENLLRTIKLKLCTTSAKSYKEIEEISIANKNLIGNILNIDLKEIVKLEKLKAISLKFFEVTDEVIDSLNSLAELYKIEFYMCDFKTTKSINSKIKEIVVYCCNGFKKEILKDCSNLEFLELTNSGLADIREIQKYKDLKVLKIRDCSVISLPQISVLENIEYLYINNVEIQYEIDISKMKNLKFISLSGSNILNKDLYIQKLQEQNSDIEIECRENDLPIG